MRMLPDYAELVRKARLYDKQHSRKVSSGEIALVGCALLAAVVIVYAVTR